MCVNDDGSTFKILPATGFQRVKIPARVASAGIGLKISQVGVANDLKVYDIEADVHEREPSR